MITDRRRLRRHSVALAGLLLAGSALPGHSTLASSREFRVFFLDDTTDLTPRYIEIIQEAVRQGRAWSRECARVLGSSDRTGTPERRRAISRLRAEAVARELVRFGMEPECVIVEACGDRAPLVPVPEGVREVQNRRVDIIHFPKDGGPRATLRPGPNCPWERMPGAASPTATP